MGEMEGLVIMEGNEQVRVGRQLEVRQLLEAVPAGGTDDDDSRRVGLTDERQDLRQERIPIGCTQLGMRLIQELEGDVPRRIDVARRDLAPEGRELDAAQCEVFRA